MGIIKLWNNYRTLGRVEFLKRWKEGIAQTSPLEQTKAQLVFSRISLLGIALGFCVSVYNAKSFWWLAIILGAAFGNTYISHVALKQKIKALQNIQDILKSATEAQVQNV